MKATIHSSFTVYPFGRDARGISLSNIQARLYPNIKLLAVYVNNVPILRARHEN